MQQVLEAVRLQDLFISKTKENNKVKQCNLMDASPYIYYQNTPSFFPKARSL